MQLNHSRLLNSLKQLANLAQLRPGSIGCPLRLKIEPPGSGW